MPLLDKKNIRFSEIYSEYYSIVFGSIYTKVGGVDTAEDLAQEVFIRFFSKMEEVYNIRAWLFGTIRYVLSEYYRKQKNMPEDLAEAEAGYDIALTFVNGFRDTRIIIDEAIAEINDERDRNIFDLVAIQNYTYEQAGKELGLTKRQIKYRYGLIVKDVIIFLNKKGIKNIEDLL